jgi:hypothetical protein
MDREGFTRNNKLRDNKYKWKDSSMRAYSMEKEH